MVIQRRLGKAAILAAAALALTVPARPDGFRGGVREALGPRFEAARDEGIPRIRARRGGTSAMARLRYWNAVANDASGVDHTPLAPGEDRVFGEQIGPGRASRAMAVVHIAMFEAVNAVLGGYESYVGLPFEGPRASMDAALAQAAHDTLAVLFPSQAAAFDDLLVEDLRSIREGRARTAGIDLGRRAAFAILSLRNDDGSQHPEPRLGTGFFVSGSPGKWRQDPVSQIPLALGSHWGEVKPFVLASPDQFRAPPPPAMESAEYAAAYDEAKRLGGDGVTTPTERTTEQTMAGLYWAYDGTPSLCAPPRLYNQITLLIAEQMGTGVDELARLLALVNVAMADAGTAIWESKYYYQVWRPVTGIREADAGTGPTGLGDGNRATRGDSNFMPLGAPASNLTGPNFTPPFPAYPSGHAGFGGALFQILRRFYGTDDIPFTFISDELNGETLGRDGTVRPMMPRTFSTLSQAEEDNGQSRIYLGIHWSFDKTEGIAQGRRVADWVYDHAFRPARRR